jgi:hypothetical protein
MRRSMYPRALHVFPALGLLAALGCGSGGGGSSGASQQGVAGASSAAHLANPNQAQWNVALAAMANGQTPPLPVTFEAPAFDAWNDLVARAWPECRRILDPLLTNQVTTRVSSLAGTGNITSIQNLRNIVVDTQQPLAFRGTGSGSLQVLRIEAPRAGGTWRLAFTADVIASYTVPGFPLAAMISAPVTVDVSDIQIAQEVEADVSNPERPFIRSIRPTQATLRITISSPDPLIQALTGTITSIIDPLIRSTLSLGTLFPQQQLQAIIAHTQAPPYGLGGQPAAAVAGAPDLETLAVELSEIIQRDHMPGDTVIPARYDDPTYKHGNVVGFDGHGDSAIWTGHYVMAEALRYTFNADARALAGAERGLRGLEKCLDVSRPYDGLLGRVVIPVASPFHAQMNTADPDYYTGVSNGVAYAAYGDISRDQYLGAFMAAEQCYLRVPSLRPLARSNISRMVDYLTGHEWNAYFHNDPLKFSRASPMAQTPGVVLAFLKAANLVDPVKYGPEHDRHAAYSSLMWLSAWTSSREIHESYYKFNLGTAQMVLVCSAETDPARYRDYLKSLQIDRDVLGHHDNAWFDAVHGMVVPSQAPAMGARVKNELQRWTLRPRRGFDITNSTDPTIPKAPYSSPLFTQGQGAPLYATEPVPIEKRPFTDFLWQRDPFNLDGGASPYEQSTGTDMILPFWLAKSYGFLP